MRTINDLKHHWDCWTDPGGHDGPHMRNGQPVCDEVSGAVTFEAQSKERVLPPLDDLLEWANDEAWPVLVTTWQITYSPHCAKFVPLEYDASACDPESFIDEPDPDSLPGGYDDI